VVDEVRAFGPATVANLGAGFDILGVAVDGLGDVVTARRVAQRGVAPVEILRASVVLPTDPTKNVAGVAAAEVLRRSGAQFGVSLSLEKGLGVGTGLGSSAASAAAAAVAVNGLLDTPLTDLELVSACVEAEAVASGRHADNVAAAVLGGLVFVQGLDPLVVTSLPLPGDLYMALASPHLVVETRSARQVLPTEVPQRVAVEQMGRLGAFVAACYRGDLEALVGTMVDDIAAKHRYRLIPGAQAAVDHARSAGALGASLAGSGPSVFALCPTQSDAVRVGEGLVAEFARAGVDCSVHTSPLGAEGARIL
jgi:homoserine kinase